MGRRIEDVSKGFGWYVLFILLLLLFLLAHKAQSGEPGPSGDSPIQLLKPEEGCVNVAKKPWIKCAIRLRYDPTRLLVLLDGTDISGMLDIASDGFEYKAHTLLAAGEHSLSVTVTTPDGEEIKREFKFSTCHSKVFDELYSSNEITTIAEKKAIKTGDTITSPSWRFESNLGNESVIKEDKWEFNFKTNLRYLDQDLPVTFPPGKGFSLANYLFQAKYGAEKLSFLAETGDVVINETPYTVTGLARRGGNMVLQLKDLNLQLRTFDVKSEQLFGFKGGLGFGTTANDHLMGASLDWGIISDKLRFRTLYVSGGEEGDSMGISTTAHESKGDVLGFLLRSDFFDGKVVAEGELDLAWFDQDTSDEFRKRRDMAYRASIGGTIKDYTYEALYEYVGPDYEVIGNPGLPKDRTGYALKAGGTFFKIHGLNLSFSQYHDNTKRDDLYPVTYTTQATVDYSFSKFESLPFGLSYQRSMLRTKDEPLDTPHTRTDTDVVTGKINYITKPWDLGVMASYSFQNDRTETENDTTTVTYAFTPTLTLDYLSICPSFSFIRSLAHLTRVYTNTYTATLDLKGDLFDKRVTYGVGGTYTAIRSSDRLIQQDTQNANFNVYYLLFKDLLGFLNPSVGVRGLYNRTNDKVLRQTTDEFALYLVLQTTMNFLL